MSQPVKLSDALVLDARLAGKAVERSIAGQVEFWARIGRGIEPLLQGTHVLTLCQNAAVRPLSDCLTSADSPTGRRRVTEFLQSQPWPHYEAHPKQAGVLVRVEANGKRMAGRFVNRQFQPIKVRAAR
jgi:ParD-like antitoxin of type II bacterial toxin-antitoxin system